MEITANNNCFQYLVEMITPFYRIDRFSYIDDKNMLHENVETTEKTISDNYGCLDGCTVLELTKYDNQLIHVFKSRRAFHSPQPDRFDYGDITEANQALVNCRYLIRRG